MPPAAYWLETMIAFRGKSLFFRDSRWHLKQSFPPSIISFSQRGQTWKGKISIWEKHSSQIQKPSFRQPKQWMGKRVSKINVFILENKR